MPHDLSHSHSQLLGFQINALSHIHLSINSLNSHLYLSSFHLFLLLQTLALNLHMHLQVPCQIMCLVSLILDIKLNTLTFMFLTVSRTQDLWIIDTITTSTTFIYFNTKDRTQVHYC